MTKNNLKKCQLAPKGREGEAPTPRSGVEGATRAPIIDPALGLIKEFAKVTGGVPSHIQKMRQETIFKEGVVPTKYKVLASVLWAINAKCEPCIRFYIQQAAKSGASEEELGEYLAVAATMGGCVGEMWALKAYHAYKDKTVGQEQPAACCQERGEK